MRHASVDWPNEQFNFTTVPRVVLVAAKPDYIFDAGGDTRVSENIAVDKCILYAVCLWGLVE